MPAGDRARLIRQLQGAHSGELAAGYAYRGHWHSLREGPARERIRVIEAEEWHHRELVRGLLEQLGARPNPVREAIFYAIGKFIAAFCHAGGWFVPMYGAGRLERTNIVEYEDAAVLASRCGQEEMIDCLLQMAEVEWEHEKFFREQVEGHWMVRVFKIWPVPPPKSAIRAKYREVA
jgi:rubrerythrin